MTATIRLNEITQVNDNILTEFCNFNEQTIWNVTQNATDAVVTNSNSSERYNGISSIKVHFTGTSLVKFTKLDQSMQSFVKKTGWHILRFSTYKNEITADMNIGVHLKVNGNLNPENLYYANLYQSSGNVDNIWNTYYQRVYLVKDQPIDFVFEIQSDTTDTDLWIDGLKLEVDDKNLMIPSLFSEAPTVINANLTNLTIPTIPANSTYKVSMVLAGSDILDVNFISLRYPKELIDLLLIVSQPCVTSHDSVSTIIEFIIYNPTTTAKTPPVNQNYHIKVI